jgi:hypothetical protein
MSRRVDSRLNQPSFSKVDCAVRITLVLSAAFAFVLACVLFVCCGRVSMVATEVLVVGRARSG